MQKNASSLAIVAGHTAENEPSEVDDAVSRMIPKAGHGGMLTEAVAETSGGTGGPTSHESILGGLDVSRIVATIQRLTANTEESKAQLEDYKNKSALPEG